MVNLVQTDEVAEHSDLSQSEIDEVFEVTREMVENEPDSPSVEVLSENSNFVDKSPDEAEPGQFVGVFPADIDEFVARTDNVDEDELSQYFHAGYGVFFRVE